MLKNVLLLPSPSLKLRPIPVHLSTSLQTRGGISAVLQVYQQAGFFREWRIKHIESHRDTGGPLQKIRCATQAALDIFNLWRQGRMAVLHVHTASGPSFWRKLLISVPVLLSKTPVIMHVHGGAFQTFYQRSNKLQRFLIRWALERSRLVLGLTEEWVATLTAIAPRARVQALVNPVEMPATPLTITSKFDATPRNTVLYLGLLDRKKGVYDLLEAFSRLPASMSDTELVLAGSGDIEGLRAMARAKGIENRVRLPGWIGIAEKKQFLDKAVCLALPSYAEGLPMAVLEALAHGIPVVASAVGGIPQVVKPNETGYLLAPGNIDMLTQHLTQILAEPEAARAMGKRGQVVIHERYAATAVLQILEEMYQQIGIRKY